MHRQEQLTQARKICAFLDQRTTALADEVYLNPVTGYTCPDRFAAERKSFFRDGPVFMGLSCEFPQPGSFRAENFDGVPILIVRDDAGTLRAFLNVCRHRGAQLLDGRGECAASFSCPYHGWSYARDGSLAAIPHLKNFDAIDQAEYGLTPLPLVERDGMIWVVPKPGAEIDVTAHLTPGLEDEFKSYDLAGYHHYETRTLEQEMNWKLVIDTFLETYHLNVLHKDTLTGIIESNVATCDGFGRNLRAMYVRPSFKEMRRQPEEDWDVMRHTAVIYVLFPNTVFIVQGDHLESWRVEPVGGPDRARMYISLYTPEPTVTDSARRHWDNNMQLLMDVVRNEDFPVGEGIQRSFHSDAQPHVTFGRNEPALGYYHRAIRDALEAAA